MMEDLNKSINNRIKELEIAIDIGEPLTDGTISWYTKGRRDQQIGENIFLHQLVNLIKDHEIEEKDMLDEKIILDRAQSIIYKNQIHDQIVNYMRLMPVSILINVRDLFKEIHDMKMDYLDFLKEKRKNND